MKLAFRMRPASGWQSHVVALFAGRPVHVEPLFADGRAFRAVPGQRCAFVDGPALATLNAGDWRVVDLAALGLDEARARAYCEALCGARYDSLRSVAGWWGWELDRVDAENCCEVSAACLIAAGAPAVLHGRPSTTPKRLLAAVEDLLVHVIVRRELGAVPTSPSALTVELARVHR